MYKRRLTLPSRSFFLFGPRGTGKSTWLHEALPIAKIHINLLKSKSFLRYKRDPGQLALETKALSPGDWVIIDEVQKLPELLDEVHDIMFSSQHQINFALSGSSARKLKRADANMLAGRALSRRMFPLCYNEYSADFNLQQTLDFGQLPMSVTMDNNKDRADFLAAYCENYLREEIQQEALVRNLDSFFRFLSVIAVMNGQVLNVSNIARDVGIARSTVQGYFSILIDTLIGWYLPAWTAKARVKEVHHPKFFLFDCGVQKALSGRLQETAADYLKGDLFETFVVNELRAINDTLQMGAKLFYWRSESGIEVDIIWQIANLTIGIEIKSADSWQGKYNKGLATLLKENKIQRAYGIYTGEHKLQSDQVTVFPIRTFLEDAETLLDFKT